MAVVAVNKKAVNRATGRLTADYIDCHIRQLITEAGADGLGVAA
jgi:hypothetical protein